MHLDSIKMKLGYRRHEICLGSLCKEQSFMLVIILWHRVLCQQHIDMIYAPHFEA